MQKLLATNSQSAFQQNEYIREYMYIYNAAKNLAKEQNITATDVFDVPLPDIDTKKVKICLRDDGEDEELMENDVVFRRLLEDVESIGVPKEKRAFNSFLRKKKKQI
jgi:hypothetical protein